MDKRMHVDQFGYKDISKYLCLPPNNTKAPYFGNWVLKNIKFKIYLKKLRVSLIRVNFLTIYITKLLCTESA